MEIQTAMENDSELKKKRERKIGVYISDSAKIQNDIAIDVNLEGQATRCTDMQ